MNRRIWLLNLVLAGAAAYGGVQLRKEWQAGKDRDTAQLNRTVKPPAPPAFTPLPPDPPVLAASYAPVAQKFLFDRERNPNVVLDVKPEPPPPPMPALPIYHGMMQVGVRPVAFLSLTNEGAHQAVHPGEPIGPFKMAAISSDEITFEWNGQTVRKRLDELPRPTAVTAAAPVADNRTPPAAPTPPPPVATGPGAVTPFGKRDCALNDGHNEGDVVDGYKKVVYISPFGKNCAYEPVGK